MGVSENQIWCWIVLPFISSVFVEVISNIDKLTLFCHYWQKISAMIKFIQPLPERFSSSVETSLNHIWLWICVSSFWGSGMFDLEQVPLEFTWPVLYKKNLNKMKPNCRIPVGSTLLIATWVLFEETLNWVHCLISWLQSEARLTQHNLLTHISNGVSVSECTQAIHRYSGTSRLVWLEKQTYNSGAL